MKKVNSLFSKMKKVNVMFFENEKREIHFFPHEGRAAHLGATAAQVSWLTASAWEVGRCSGNLDGLAAPCNDCARPSSRLTRYPGNKAPRNQAPGPALVTALGLGFCIMRKRHRSALLAHLREKSEGYCNFNILNANFGLVSSMIHFPSLPIFQFSLPSLLQDSCA